MQEFTTFLRDFGFPVVVSLYLLIRFEKIITNLAKVIGDSIVKLDDVKEQLRVIKDELKFHRKSHK